MRNIFVTSPDNLRIAYDVSGEGPALMLLHGGGGSRREWHEEGYVARLKDEFKVITVDIRGHGESDKPLDPAFYTTDKMGEDFLAVADACGVDRFVLWGFSYGGNVGRYLAARSGRVSKFIYIGSAFGPGISKEMIPYTADFHNHWEPLVQAQLEKNPDKDFDVELLSQDNQDELAIREIPGPMLPVMLAWSRAMLDWVDLRPADMICPTLWLMGSENENAMASFKAYKAGIEETKVQVHVLDGLDHMAEFQEVDWVLPVMLAFTRS